MKRTVLIVAAAAALAAGDAAADFNLLDIVGVEAGETSLAKSGRARRQRRPVKVEREAEGGSGAEPQACPVTNVVEKVVVVTSVVERVVERVVTNVVERVVTNVVEKVVVNDVERVVTNVVEKVVEDPRREVELVALTESNDDLKRRLADSEDRNARLARVVPPSALKQLTGRPAKISSQSTYYDRKEGFAVFTGRVHVDDEQYQMHAGKAYVFFDGTNQLKRLVAVGGVALTNGTKRAYGAKASYHRDSGMVVLYSGDGSVAEVRDESKVQDQTVRGERIKFWIGAEQVEVLDARISAPAGGGGLGDIDKLNIGR